MMFIQTREYIFADSLGLFWVDIPENDNFDIPVFDTKWGIKGPEVQEILQTMLQLK